MPHIFPAANCTRPAGNTQTLIFVLHVGVIFRHIYRAVSIFLDLHLYNNTQIHYTRAVWQMSCRMNTCCRSRIWASRRLLTMLLSSWAFPPLSETTLDTFLKFWSFIHRNTSHCVRVPPVCTSHWDCVTTASLWLSELTIDTVHFHFRTFDLSWYSEQRSY